MHKSVPAQIKAAGTDDGLLDGQFKALVSVFGNKDSYGDVIRPGAFADTIAEWKASGDSIPVYWSHQMQDPDMNIGWVVDAKESEAGLEVLAQLDTDPDASPKAKQVYRLLKGRRVTQFSFAYDVLDGGMVDTEDDSFYELRSLKLHEVGPTPIGANSETELLAVKRAAAAATGLSASIATKNADVLREVAASAEALTASIKSVLAATDGTEASTTNTEEPASGTDQAKDEEPEGAKSEEPRRAHPSVATWETALELSVLEGDSL